LIFIFVSSLFYSGTQTFIANYILSDIAKKTNKELRISNLSISITKGINMYNVFFEDANNDTLLYANEIKIKFNILNYFSNNLSLTKLELTDATVKITSNADSIFNFQYIIDEFSTNSNINNSDTTKNKLPINLNNVDIVFDNVNFVFTSKTSGIDLRVRDVDLLLNTDSIDIAKMKYYADNINIKNANIEIDLYDTDPSVEIPDSSELVLNVGANKIDLSNIKFTLKDKTDSMYIYSEVADGEIYPKLVDIPNQKITADSININNAITTITFDKKALSQDTTTILDDDILRIIPQIDWYFACKKTNLSNSSFSLNDNYTKDTSKVFDYNHFSFANIQTSISDAIMDNDIIKGDINKLSTIDKNNYSLKQFKGNATIKKNNLKLDNFFLQTGNSITSGYCNIKYKSFNNFINNNFEIDTANILINESNINLADINYFYKIDTIEYIKNEISTNIKLASIIKANKNKISLSNTNIQLFTNTSLFFNGEILNYTDTSNIKFISNINLLKTTEDDLRFIINDSVQLPKFLVLNGFIKYTNDTTNSAFNIKSEFGESNLNANIIKSKYNINLELINNNFTSLLDSVSVKNINLKATAQGEGFNINNSLLLNIIVDSININNEKLKNISIKTVGDKNGYNVNIISTNNSFNLNLNSNIYYNDYKLTANIDSKIKNISLKKLGILKNKNNISLNIKANISTHNDTTFTTNIDINNFKDINDAKIAHFDFINSKINISDTSSTVDINSDILNCNIKSNYNLFDSKDIFVTIFNHYFAVADTTIQNKKLYFNLQINDNNLVQSNLINGLKFLNSTPITGNIVSTNNTINIKSKINTLVYDDYKLDTFTINIENIDSLIKYNINLKSLIAYDSLKVDLLSAKGILSNDTATFTFTNKENEKIKYNIGLYYSSINDSLSYFGTLPNLVIDSLHFNTNTENKIIIGKNHLEVKHFEISNKNQRVYINPSNNLNEIKVLFKNINLNQFSGKYLYKRDLISGILNGNIKYNINGLFSSELDLNNLIVFEEKQGDLHLKINSKKAETNYNIQLTDNKSIIDIEGKFINYNNKIEPSFKLKLKNFRINKFQFFLKDAFKTLKGKINGNLQYNTNNQNKKLTGQINFEDVKFKSKLRKSTLYIHNQTISVDNNNLTLNKFSIKDSLDNLFIISGNINNLSLNNYELHLKMDINDFLIFDVANNDKTPLYGKLILDNKSTITGNVKKIIIDSDIKLKKGSELTYVYPQNKMANEISTEGIVEFNTEEANDYLKQQIDTIAKDWISLFEINSTIKIDKNTKFNLIFDKNSGEGLNIEGGADLSLNIGNNGNINLIGNYTVEKGFYDISYYNIVGRKFKILKDSKIIWTGNPYNPISDLTAEYKIKAHPYPIMINTTNTSKAELNKYKTAETFYVSLNISKELLKPEMKFKIIYPRLSENSNNPDVRARINQINEDEAQVNKQALSLLIIGGFVTDDGNYVDGGNTVINNSVSSILTGQLNNISDKYLKGIDFDVNIDSKSNYNTEGNIDNTQTDVKLKVKKYLFKNRVVLEVAGGVTVNESNTNIENDAGLQDAAVEYLITEDGKYKLRAFSQKDYSTINQDVQETGISFIFTTDFDRVNDLFKKTSIDKE